MQVHGTGNSILPPLPSDPRERLEFTARQLQAVWLKHVLKEARGSESTFLNNSMASKMFKDIFDEVLAEKMAERDVLGVTDAITSQVLPSDTTGSTSSVPETQER